MSLAILSIEFGVVTAACAMRGWLDYKLHRNFAFTATLWAAFMIVLVVGNLFLPRILRLPSLF